jgi:hypothetical protein
MIYDVALRAELSTVYPESYSPEALWRIGRQVEALLSQHSSLEMYRRSIEWQLGLIAAQIHAEEDVLLTPHSVFLLLELRGSGGVSAQLEQIARTLREVGYWKPPAHVQDYHRQDVYRLGKSAQQLFDDYAKVDLRVRQLNALIARIKEQRRMNPRTTPQEVFEELAADPDCAQLRGEIDAVVELLGHTQYGVRLGWPLVRCGTRSIQLA